MPLELDLLSPGQIIWLTLTALCALTLAWVTLRLIMVGLKWTFVATVFFLAASPFLQPLNLPGLSAEKIQIQLPEIQAQATKVFQELGSGTQKIAVYAYNEFTKPDDS